jgi:hypothetical protein
MFDIKRGKKFTQKKENNFFPPPWTKSKSPNICKLELHTLVMFDVNKYIPYLPLANPPADSCQNIHQTRWPIYKTPSKFSHDLQFGKYPNRYIPT